MTSRIVRWSELHNIRDLGGLPSARGVTRFGRIFRSPSPDRLDTAGWRAMVASGMRTLVDLRNDDEVALETNAWLTVNSAREKPRLGGDIDSHVTTARRELDGFLDATDVERFLRDAGVSVSQLASIRSRLLAA